MTKEQVLSNLLQTDIKKSKNLELLNKIILTSYLARFRINGQAPDNSISLGDYLFDNERVMFDFTRLSHKKREQFLAWFLEPHEKEKNIFNSKFDIDESRGFSAQVVLVWWQRLINWLINRNSVSWKIKDFNLLSNNYQLTDIEMCPSKKGILVGFKQFFIPPSAKKYQEYNDLEKEPLGNTKRVFITDKLVDQILQTNLYNFKADLACKNAHPHSIQVFDVNSRFEEMQQYRTTQQFIAAKPWYLRLWHWCVSWFVPEKTIPKRAQLLNNPLHLLHQSPEIKIYEKSRSKEIVVVEKRPEIENMVFCGGGPKIFAHVGVWKAVNEAQIKPTRFAGSSSGAMMALMCYLGYSAEEMAELFKNFKQENLVYYDISLSGLSDSHALKASLDYAIIRKVREIVTKYNIPYPQGKITFSTLESLRQQCPDCGLGKELIVTATNKRLRNTSYFSFEHSPNMEVSEAVKTSALLPVVYKANIINGHAHSDGGVLNNFPTEIFSDDYRTLLESEDGNNLKVLAVQFDNGVERSVVDKIMSKVYRENPLLNWVYGILTGVNDPASGWELDRLKLRQYAMQTIIPEIDNISISNFTVDVKNQEKLIENGYKSTKEYLDARYGSKADTKGKSQELMYSTFASLGDLLSYCCYRGDKTHFELVNNLITQSHLPNRTSLMKQSLALRKLYFNKDQQDSTANNVAFFAKPIMKQLSEKDKLNADVLLALHPLFIKLSQDFVINKQDKKLVQAARHSLSRQAPFHCLNHFAKIKGDVHVILHILMKCITELKKEPSEKLYSALKQVEQFLFTQETPLTPEYFAHWDLTIPQCLRVLKLLNNGQHSSVKQLLYHLRKREEPLQEIVDGKYCDNLAGVGALVSK